MSIVTTSLLPSLLLVAAATAPVGSSAEARTEASPVSVQDPSLYPAATGDLTLDVERADTPTTLIDVLTAYGDLTSQTFTYDNEVENLLRHGDLNLTRSRTVPKGEVQSWVENLLAQNHFVLQPVLRGTERLTAVHSAHHAPFLRGHAVAVDAEDLPGLRHHAATIVSTVIDLPNTDVRQVVNSMRNLVHDSNLQSILPAGSSSSMLLTGRAPWVADLVASLQAIDASEGPDRGANGAIGVEMLRFPLEHARADVAAQLVEGMVAATVEISGGPVANQAGQFQPQPVRVLFDGRTNALLATCRADLVPSLRQAVALVDVEAPPMDIGKK